MLLDGKRLLVTGVLTDDSLAYAIAQTAIEDGADVVLTGFGRSMSLEDALREFFCRQAAKCDAANGYSHCRL